jgi:class 3 adenylate cyclase
MNNEYHRPFSLAVFQISLLVLIAYFVLATSPDFTAASEADSSKPYASVCLSVRDETGRKEVALTPEVQPGTGKSIRRFRVPDYLASVWPLVFTLTGAFVLWLLLFGNPLEIVELRWLGQLLRWRAVAGIAPAVDSHIVHLDIDRQEFESFSTIALEYQNAARIISEAAELGAKVVVFDIIFSRGSKEESQPILDAIEEAKRRGTQVVLAEALEPRPSDAKAQDRIRSFLFKERLTEPAGLINAQSDPDGVLRRYAIVESGPQRPEPSLALAAYLLWRDLTWKDVSFPRPNVVCWPELDPNNPSSEVSRKMQTEPLLLNFRTSWNFRAGNPNAAKSVFIHYRLADLHLRNSTPFAERLGANGFFSLLNQVFEIQTRAVTAEDGNLEHFLGDQFLSYWGAPHPQPDATDRALRAALWLSLEMERFRKDLPAEVRELFGYGVALHSGLALVGNKGSRLRLDYGVVGDLVNTAARVESLTKYYSVRMLVTRDAYAKLTIPPPSRLLDHIMVKGKNVPIEILEIKDSLSKPNFEEIAHTYSEAFNRYRKGEFDVAEQLFRRLAECENDPASSVLMRRCAELSRDPPRVWQGVFRLETK